MNSRRRYALWKILLLAGIFVLPLLAQEKPAPVDFSAKDITGAAVKAPDAKKVSVLVFALPDQTQSQQAIEQVKATVRDPAATQVFVIFSGKDADSAAKKLAAAGITWPIIVDPDYAASGKLSVHVWPTTVVVKTDGELAAHLGGLPKTFATDLDSYLAFAAGKIDLDTLHKRLDLHDTVIDSAAQMADRHLQVAQRLMDKDLPDQAKLELEQGLKIQPQHTGLQLALAEVSLALGDSQGALTVLNTVDEKTAPPRRLQILRGRALAGLGKLDEAKAILIQAVQLNPDPAEAYYQLGLVYEQQGDMTKAAESFRRAFETTSTGRKIAVTSPTTKP